MAPGPENGAWVETPQPSAPTRIAGRCGSSGGAARPPLFIPHRFLFPIRPSLRRPGVFQPPPQTRLTDRDRAVWEAGWGRVATWRESPHNRPHRGKQRGTGRAGLSPLPLPDYIVISGLSWSSSHHWPGRAGHFLLHYLCAVILQRQPGLLLAVSFHLSPEKLFFCWIERI